MNSLALKKHSVQLFDRTFLAVHPALVKRRIFRQHDRLSWRNVRQLHLEPELLIAPKLMKKGQSFIDIGANKGEYAYCVSKQIPEAEIYAIEPIPTSHQCLQKILPHIRVFPFAISDKNGVAQFKIPLIGDSEYHTRGTLRVDYAEDNETAQRLLEVQTITLDEFVRQEEIEHLGLVKIDVEGNEEAVLAGAQETLRRQKPVLIVEIEQRHHQNRAITEIIEDIHGLGYNSLYFDLREFTLRGTDELFNGSNSLGHRHYPNNYIFLPKHENLLQFQTLIAEEISADCLSV